jgi:hypothetical protein
MGFRVFLRSSSGFQEMLKMEFEKKRAEDEEGLG